MMARITYDNVEERVANVNRRMEYQGAHVRYTVSHRYDYYAIDREILEDGAWRPQNAVKLGTKSELGEFLNAMMIALDDAELYGPSRRSDYLRGRM